MWISGLALIERKRYSKPKYIHMDKKEAGTTMEKIIKLATLMVTALTLMLFTATVSFAAEGVNWEESIITVKGMGLAPKNAINPTQANLLARRAAVVDGYRLLAELIKGVNVDAETTVENLMVSSDVVRTNVSACIKGARIISENKIADGYEITMQVNMFGETNPLAAAVIPRPSYQEPFPEPDASVEPSPIEKVLEVEVNVNTQSAVNQNYSRHSLMISDTAKPLSVLEMAIQSGWLPLATDAMDAVSAKPVKEAKKNNHSTSVLTGKEKSTDNLFTGLIVDCRGLGLSCAMSPVIKNKKGEAIYGHKNLDYDLVISKGVVSYTTDINNYDRAGSKPLKVKAIALENFNGNPVISVADANRVLIENRKAGFLDKMNVVFVR